MYENGNLTAFPEAGNLTAFPESGNLTAFAESGVLASFPESGLDTALGLDPGFFGFQFGQDAPDTGVTQAPAYGSDTSSAAGMDWSGSDVADVVTAGGGLITAIIEAATGKTNGSNGGTPPPVVVGAPRSPFSGPWIWLGGAAILAVLLMRKR